MAGHVNMMDDCLILNLPPATLRSALRLLVSQGSVTQQPFVKHVRAKFFENPPSFTTPEELFPGHDIVAPACLEYLAQTRCIFSCKLAKESLPYLEHFIQAIPQANARWTENSKLTAVLAKFDGDVIQAVQALKESRPEPSPKLLSSLNSLLGIFKVCEWYCESAQPPLTFPFTRSRRQVCDVMDILFARDASAFNNAKQATIAIPTRAAGGHVVGTFSLGPFEMPRLFNGLWQVSSPSWGSGGAREQETALAQAVSFGMTAADMADHYGDAELIYGDFRNRLTPEIRDKVYAATKWCIFSPVPTPIPPSFVLDAVRERCRRLGGRVELLQFHWQNYEDKEYLPILTELLRISKSHPELVSSIGLCNFDAEHVAESCEYLIAKTGAVGIVSNQVQFSLVDARPLRKMVSVCEKYGLKLLTYGSFCGGFLSERWLHQPAPAVYLESHQLTPSQRKYFDMIQTWGTWTTFQSLLSCLFPIADKHKVSISNIATRWVLQQPTVGAVIVGTRLGVSDHIEDNLRVFGFSLDNDDMQNINAVALGPGGEKVSALFDKLGDCGNEYRKIH
ncbi:aldo/keto reductase [Hypoxylon trugodes]|uniref:aldo/keto reductase n=1 Tax=Hypoxylon trugodes TaxID=326681 RepID=UPI00218CD5EF|nr:aldo/keto reductase [Hypoxylon trugodes]KAI1387990.1 aldo/keto reductase [Hypoxylon trugodes]